MQNPKTRAILLFLLALTFGVLIFGGYLISREKPPIPARVVDAPDLQEAAGSFQFVEVVEVHHR